LGIHFVKAVSESSNRASMKSLAALKWLRPIAHAKKETGPVPASVTLRPPVAHLRVLDISDCGLMTELLTWLQPGGQVDTLQLNITNDISGYSDLMRILGPSLTVLKINFITFRMFEPAAAGLHSLLLSMHALMDIHRSICP
jgi:hypothetical protein